jgi:phosphoribosylformimino-5-aminoimidazole carboxamide ribotide isomerase
LVSDILAEHVSEIQVGGGVHDSDIIERHFADGAVRVILGARALEDANWLSDMAEIYPGALVVSVEARQGALTTHGSGHQKSRPLSDVVDDLASLPLGALLLTTVDAAGRECRPDPLTVEDVLERAGTLVHVATDASSISDLDALEDRGVSVAIVGLPLYSGALDPRDVAEAFGE